LAQSRVIPRVPVTIFPNVVGIKNLPKRRKQNPSVSQAGDSRNELDNLNTLLQNFTFDDTNNSFLKNQTPNPKDPSNPIYSLPDYLNPFVLTLVAKMNDHKPPDNLAKTLAPFINFNATLNQYVLSGFLDLRILQMLDKLYNAGRQTPFNLVNKVIDALNRSKSQ
jgi:hypothetical protein